MDARARAGRRSPPTQAAPDADWSRIDVDVGSIDRAVDLGPHGVAALHRARRRQRGRPDGDGACRCRSRSGRAASVTIEVKWTAHVPRTFARTGAIGNFFFIAQWFPKLGVLQDDGLELPPVPRGHRVLLRLRRLRRRADRAAGWPSAPPASQRERRDNADGTTTHRYYQEDVHDFAWTTSPDFVERTARFEHPTLPPVEMRLLLQPEHAGQAERHFDATRTTLKYYGEWFGAYPVRPHHDRRSRVPERRRRHGVSDALHRRHALARARRVTTPEGVTVHEAGHQFWYGIVGNNEFEDAWMDEGLQHVLDRAGDRAGRTIRTTSRCATSAGSCRGCSRTSSLPRETDGNRPCRLSPRARRATCQSTPTFRYFPSTRRRASPTTRPRCG